MRATTLLMALALAFGALVHNTFAQRGVGEPAGVARQAIRPDVVTLTGTLVEVDTGPCEQTTGRSPVGTHILLEAEAGKRWNVHLGPAAEVAEIVAKLTVGQKLSVQAFHTEKMQADHYVAQSIASGETTMTLRDASLRPVWAGPAAAAATTTPPAGPASRPGRGGGPPPWAGRGRGRGGRGTGFGASAADPLFEADREVFHGLLEDHAQVRRSVTLRDDGIDAVTESDDPAVAAAIQAHVAAMHRRLKEGQPIHMRDPLFAALFAHADQITLEVKNTEKGVRIVETSADPYVVKLIQAHADAVSRFAANGFPEARQNHAVPEK